MEVAAQLSVHFPGGRCINWKNRKKCEYLRRHSTDFHQVFTNVSDVLIHVIDDIENVGQGQQLRKCSFLTREYFLKNSQRQISLTVIGSQTFQRAFGIGICQ